MAERKEGKPLQFKPAYTLRDLYNAAFGPMSDQDLTTSMLKQTGQWLAKLQEKDPKFLQLSLLKIFRESQNRNAEWTEGRFRQIREQMGDWSYDGMWVFENGETVGAALWSTFNTFFYNAQHNFQWADLIRSIVQKERMVYPLSPKYETVMFFQPEDAPLVLKAIQSATGDFELEDYKSGLRMARVRQGKVGPMSFANVGITMGNIGFWESRKLALGQFGFGIYVPRVSFRDTVLLPKGAYITPLDADEVKTKGGKLMEEKYPEVPIVRVSKERAAADFIAAALSASRPNADCPIVVSYTTPRLWLGEGPKHGPGRTAADPTISHL